MAANPMYSTVFKQFGSLLTVLRQLSRLYLRTYTAMTAKFCFSLERCFPTLGTGHMYLLRVLIGSFDCLHLVIGLVLVYDT